YAIGSITGSILDFGRKKKKYQASIAAYEQARYTYEQSVLQAFTDVNNAIVTYKRVYEAAALKAELRDAASKYVQLAHVQYKGGTLNYIDVLDAQRRYFDAQISLSNALRDEYLAVVALYKALGGGWDMLQDDKNNTKES
ncbi:TolC family protein, partial [uncultured Duncaniella sp.]